MNRIFKPASLLMYVLVGLVFFVVGAAVSGVADVAKGQGLAGGAIVVYYGIVTAIVAFIASLFIAYKTSNDAVVRINKIFGVLLLLVVCIVVFRAGAFN